MTIEQALCTIEQGQDASRDRENYTARRVDLLIRLVRREYRAPHSIAFAFFYRKEGKTFTMPATTAPNITIAQILAFGLIGATPQGDTFVEPTVEVQPATAGTVALQPSIQGAGGAFTTAGVFTPASGFTGSVTLSADVQGVDDQDATFSVTPVPEPETVSFDTTQFAAQAAPANTVATTGTVAASPTPGAGA